MNLKLLGLVMMTMYIVDVTTAQHTNATEKADDKDVDEIIEMILASGRQGRNIDGLDDVYGDPTIQNALNSGDDAEARNLIRDKLCALGLMQCDEVQGKRPSYYSPDDLIYAQPIAIKPVGRPIPSVPFRGPPPSQQRPNYSKYPPPPTHNGPYGPPKPMPSSLNGPPRKVGYGGPPISKPYLNSPPSFSGPGPIYLSKPPGPIYEGPDSSPYEYEQPGKIPSFSSSFGQSASFGSSHHSTDFVHEKPTIVVNAQGGGSSQGHGGTKGIASLTGEAVQQHVHHHYHHGDDLKVPAVVVNNPVPVGVGHNSLQSTEFSSSGFQGANQLSTNGFTPMSSGLSGYYGKQQGNGISSSISSGFGGSSSGINSGFGSSSSGINSGFGGSSSGINSGFGGSSSGINSGFGPVNGVTGNGVYGSNYQSSSNLLGSYSNGGKPVYEASSFNNQGPAQFGSSGSGSGLHTNIGSTSSFGQSVSGVFNDNPNSFHSTNPDFYKKELNVNGGYSANGLTGGLSQYSTVGKNQLNQFNSQSLNQFNAGEKYQGFETGRQEQNDCVCVAYEQCPANDVIGRKDDLILPLDPRNLNGKDIDAIVDENESGNKTVVRVTKEAEKTVTESDDDDKEKSVVEGETKKVSKRDVSEIKSEKKSDEVGEQAEGEARQSFYNPRPQYNNFQNQIKQCGPRQVCCRRPVRPVQNYNTCGARNAQGITGRIKNPVYVDGDSEFGEYPWQAAILKKDPKESVYVCGGTLIDQHHIITAAHCIKSYKNFDLRVRLGEWDVNHDVEFYPYIERDVIQIHVHPEYYAGTLDNDIAILRLDRPVDYSQTPHISPACLPDKYSDFSGKRCWTTGWGKDAFGDYGKYQNILKEVDVPIIPDHQCQQQLRSTRLGHNYKLNPGFVCAGGEEGKDACKGDGGGPLVCERNGLWQLVGVVSWGIGCGQANVPGVYVRVSHYLDWINQISHQF